MRTALCILFVSNYLTQRYSCLHRIDLPLKSLFLSNAAKPDDPTKRVNLARRQASIYLPISPAEFPENYFKRTRRIQTMPPKQLTPKEFRSIAPKFPAKNLNNNPSHTRLKVTKMPYPPMRLTTPKFDIRRYFTINKDGSIHAPNFRAMMPGMYEDEKDTNLKTKISTLVQQTIHDTERKIKSIQHIKEKSREEAPYKAGFILSMIKKSRDVLNELFNVAVKHKDEWKALEQLKIFELIVHTNVDTTNLVRQLVEIHIQHLNATNPDHHQPKDSKRRVVLLK